jgi:hypothetical protein
MYSNLCSKKEILEDFNLWLLDRYDWMGFDKIDKILAKADEILEDNTEYDYMGHRNLYNQIIG